MTSFRVKCDSCQQIGLFATTGGVFAAGWDYHINSADWSPAILEVDEVKGNLVSGKCAECRRQDSENPS